MSDVPLLLALIMLRAAFYAFGTYQDSHMAVKYTDIDYLVFSDAARFVHLGMSPYARDTYRYTPLLAWMLVPNVWFSDFGKLLFVLCDVATGYWLLLILRNQYPGSRVKLLASIWLLNPMAAQISTRGSLESVLTAAIMYSVYLTVVKQRYFMAGLWMGIAAHLKLYPVIYVPTVMLYLRGPQWFDVLNKRTTQYAVGFCALLVATTLSMYYIYGEEFWAQSLWYHVIRVDHRHNFSVYNLALYYKSAFENQSGPLLLVATLAFIPQLSILAILLPLLFSRTNLIATLFLQTFAFVTFNKVITSQYFIWFLIFLPGFLARLQLAGSAWRKGLAVISVWVSTQGLWLYFAYQLEFLGKSTFDTGLLYSSCLFYLGNCYALAQLIKDAASGS